jgi:hypothetical protein
MPANVDAMVREGVNAFKAGKKEEARALLMKAAEIDQYNEQAWLWLSAVIDAPEDQRTCLENVLAINPENERARNGLQILTQEISATPAPPPARPATNDLPNSIEWDLGDSPTSSPSAAPRGAELSDDDYDDWLNNLNLPPANPASGPQQGNFSASPFGDVNVFDDDLFNSGPFSTNDMEDVFTPPAASKPNVPAAPPVQAAPPAPAPMVSPGKETTKSGSAMKTRSVIFLLVLTKSPVTPNSTGMKRMTCSNTFQPRSKQRASLARAKTTPLS